jgi:hypothetical protein
MKRCERCGRFARIAKWYDPELGRTLDGMGGPESYPVCDKCVLLAGLLQAARGVEVLYAELQGKAMHAPVAERIGAIAEQARNVLASFDRINKRP